MCFKRIHWLNFPGKYCPLLFIPRPFLVASGFKPSIERLKDKSANNRLIGPHCHVDSLLLPWALLPQEQRYCIWSMQGPNPVFIYIKAIIDVCLVATNDLNLAGFPWRWYSPILMITNKKILWEPFSCKSKEWDASWSTLNSAKFHCWFNV